MFRIVDFKIWVKILIIVIASLIGIAAVGGYGLYSSYRSTDAMGRIYNAGLNIESINSKLVQPINHLREISLSIVLAPDEKIRNEIASEIGPLVKNINENMEAVKGEFPENLKDLFDQVSLMWNKYRELSEFTRSEIDKGYRESAFVNVNGAEHKQFRALLEGLGALREAAVKTSSDTFGQASSRAEGAVTVTGVLVFAIAIVLCLLCYLVARLITRPLKVLLDVTLAVRAGNISTRLKMNRADEVGLLSESVDAMSDGLEDKSNIAGQIASGDLTGHVVLASENDQLGLALQKMTQTLNDVIGRVNQSVALVTTGAEKISDASQSLSQGTTEQASSLEEITSSMTELGSQTLNNAENATQASQLADGARNAAENGNAQMASMISAMSDIAESSKEIDKIIKVIDEIAFQTNLLALNAAVEAARAGKHGKGFAVVAQEVRNLAGRSAKAAQETAELIENSVKKVENGLEIVNKTATAFSGIVEGSHKVTGLVAEIAAASNEQAQGINQVNQGLSQVEHVTQQNAANAEEMASAALELSSQAKQLRQIVTLFRLRDFAHGNDPDDFPSVVPVTRKIGAPESWGNPSRH